MNSLAPALVGIILAATTVTGSPPPASRTIDQLVAKACKNAGLERNAPVSEEVFLRRIYLDVIGRIPTLPEARHFLESADPDKRSRLIDELLASEGYVSHFFNYWADILRLNENSGNNRPATYVYQLWIKNALRSNMPYDQFVRELVTARGFLWENGATGYYHRDRGMPLENMSNTIRIFLGTRLECAQCHDHPFDQWTQMDYYRMAAFSYGMDARIYIPANREAALAYQKEQIEVARAQTPLGRFERDSPEYLRQRAMGQVIADLFVRLKFIEVRETPDTLTLPHDYQYENARPFDPVSPATLFGSTVPEGASYDELITGYGQWLTSPENPRFTLVIANRLWKRALGQGLIEPVDELMEGTLASNPELMDFLVNRLIDLDYDCKAFLREIYHTRTYQSESRREELSPSTPYPFPGPVLRRLTAEQIWDSIVTQAIPDPDFYMPDLNGRLGLIDRIRQVYDNLESRSTAEVLGIVEEASSLYTESYLKTQELSRLLNEARAAKDKERIAVLGKELSSLRNESRNMLHNMTYNREVNSGRAEELYQNFGIGGANLPARRIARKLAAGRSGSTEDQNQWRAEAPDLMRASELPFPAPRGHFLREFGQSDREVIQNASLNASVPQALTLLNGPLLDTLGNPNAILQRHLNRAETPREKIEILFLGTLSRFPADWELELFLQEVATKGTRAYQDLRWTLLNSQSFRFQQ